MSARTAVLAGSVGLIGFLAYHTIRGMINGGSTGLVAVSVVVLALLAFGILGALTAPPDE